jgi:hypothetical protein
VGVLHAVAQADWPWRKAAAVGLDLPLNGALAEVLATMTWAVFT